MIYKELYKIAYDVWNGFMAMVVGGTFNGTSMPGLFRMSPGEAAGSSVMGIFQFLFSTLINSFTIPIATIGFMFAIIKNCLDGTDGKYLYRFGMSAAKYAIVATISLSAFSVMGGIMSLADDFSTALINGFAGANGDPYLHYADIEADIEAIFEDSEDDDSHSSHSSHSGGSHSSTSDDEDSEDEGGGLFDFDTISSYLDDKIEEIKEDFWASVILFIASIAVLFSCIGCSFVIVIEAFQRILKPLVIMPFASINLAFGSFGQDGERMMWSYLKMFFGFCVSGAIMIVSIYVGAALVNSSAVNALFSIDESSSHTYRAVIVSLKTCILPLTITGLVKGAENLASRLYS